MKLRHLLLLPLLSIFTLFSSSESLSEAERSAMLSLSKAVGAEKILNWTDAEPCNWPKVRCSNDGISVIQIGNQNLKGSLPSEIRNLTNLQHLEVQNNFLSGSLPSFRGLSNLQILLLHDNSFSSIPSDFFSGMSSLQTVSLDHNPFSPWEIPETLTGSPSLGYFSATEVNLTGTLPDFFGNLSSLRNLSLAYNWLSGPLPASLSASSVQVLWLNNQNGGGLNGSIDVIQNMTSLTQVWLHSNSFTGPIPDVSKLQSLYELNLRDNHLTGIVPNSLITLRSLKNIILANNFLQGTVPQFPKSVKTDLNDSATSNRFCLAEPGNCSELVNDLLAVVAPLGYPQKLASDWKDNDPCQHEWLGITCGQGSNVTVINFINMGFSGTISPEFQRLKYLQKLLLSGNDLTGTIPVELADLTNLVEFDVRNNSLSGAIPPFNGRVTVYTDGNPDIGKIGSGGGSSQSPGASSPSRSPSSNHGGNATDANAGSSSGGKSSAGIVVGSVIGGVVVVILVVVFLGYWFYKKKQHRFGRVQSPNTMVIHPRHSGSDSEMVKITVTGSGVNGGTQSENYSQTSSGPSDVQVVEAGNMVISIQVLRNVTNNFSEENILGRGGFGTVYKGELHDGTKIAVKRMESGVIGNKGLNEFKSEIAVLTKVRHRHLVALLGYCLDGNEKLLVYEYMPQGTLSQHLFDWKEEGLKPLEWMKRLSIALDVARGVEYLHTLAHQSFIHRDLKPSNILLGDDMKAKVADFGLVRLAPEGKGSVETRLAGTFGYLAPEYAVTGRVTTKVDVFSFGVILMELITGRRALDENQPEESVHLVTWFRRMHANKETFQKAIDPTIELTEETLASVNTVAELAGHCCAREPYQRPDMGHAVNVLSTLVDVWKPTNADFEDSYGIDLDMTLPQALKKWQEDSSATSSFLASADNTQTSIPTRPTGFAESFTSADGR